jgi:ubiquinone/menaquinone biosynthesis C-methylase UbiE
VGQAEALPFGDSSFDFVNINGILDQAFDPEVVLREAVRVSRRSVAGVVTYEGGRWGSHVVPGHNWQARSYSEAGLHALLQPYGNLVNFGTVEKDGQPQVFFFEVVVK